MTHATSPVVLQPEFSSTSSTAREVRKRRGVRRTLGSQQPAKMTERAPRPGWAPVAPHRPCPSLWSRRQPPEPDPAAKRPARKWERPAGLEHRFHVSPFIGLILLFPFLRAPALIVSGAPPPSRGWGLDVAMALLLALENERGGG